MLPASLILIPSFKVEGPSQAGLGQSKQKSYNINIIIYSRLDIAGWPSQQTQYSEDNRWAGGVGSIPAGAANLSSF